MQQYTGAKHEHNRLPAVLSFDETLVASPSESPAQVLLWDAKTGQERQRLASGGINLIRFARGKEGGGDAHGWEACLR